MRRLLPRPRTPRRGVTLIEMLVTVALLVLMMTIIVQIFQAATGAVSAAKVYQELDGSLRQLDTTIRQDLQGVTARLTPPLNPKDNLGYFEYGENSFADLQGEDTDDYLRFTAQAPEGQPFIGRVWVGLPFLQVNNNNFIPPTQPIQVTSQYAEIIYFLRNGNLYRRVLLIAPERQPTLQPTFGYTTYNPAMFGGTALVSWQGMNDLSAHPAPTSNPTLQPNAIILNALGDLTNRENRYASPRFCSDYVTNLTGAAPPDGLPDDQNPANTNNGAGVQIYGDSIPDYYPTLYPALFSAVSTFNQQVLGYSGMFFDYNLTTGQNYGSAPRLYTLDTMPFPYIFPGMYSKPEYFTANLGGGWIHSNVGVHVSTSAAPTVGQLQLLNASPLDIGDSLPFPQINDAQTWWGFPTWRETLSPAWTDPYTRISATQTQPTGLSPHNPSSIPPGSGGAWLPPVTGQPNNDSYGLLPFALPPNGWQIPTAAWEDDLILTGVRSFDVKVIDDAYGGFVDLGWGDDMRLYSLYGLQAGTPQYLAGSPPNTTVVPPVPLPLLWPPVGGNTHDLLNGSFAHEGRIPPFQADLRYNPNYPLQNVGDDSKNVTRLRRVWDSWSTEYSNAPTTGYDPSTNFPTGPPFGPPIYPSYPPPYPAPLRGIQIQIRVVDPRNQRTKVLTIRQDFSDKL